MGSNCSICILKVAGVALYRLWTQIKDNSLSTSVQDLNRATPTTFRMQIEQIRTHFEQPQIRFRTKWKIWMLFDPKHKNFELGCFRKCHFGIPRNTEFYTELVLFHVILRNSTKLFTVQFCGIPYRFVYTEFRIPSNLATAFCIM